MWSSLIFFNPKSIRNQRSNPIRPKQNAAFPHPNGASYNLIAIGPLVSEIFIFESVYGRTPARVPYYKLAFVGITKYKIDF